MNFFITRHRPTFRLGLKTLINITLLVISRTYSEDTKVSVETYTIQGKEWTFTQIQALDPSLRSEAMWLVLVDWERQKTRPYVIVDPFDEGGLLYFSEHEYKVQARTLGSMVMPFRVIARPGTSKPSPNKTTPNSIGAAPLEELFDPVAWRSMKNMRSFISRYVTWHDAKTVAVHDGNIAGLVFVWARELGHYTHVDSMAGSLDQFVDFVKHLQSILRANGSTFLIKRLKIYLFCLYSWLGGNPVSNTEELGQRVSLRGGLPRYVARQALRSSVQNGSLTRVRIWASMLNIYKYIHGEHPDPPLDTIGATPFTEPTAVFRDFATRAEDGFFPRLSAVIGKIENFSYESAYGLKLTTAGANTSMSLSSINWDATSWALQPVNWPLKWFEFFGDDKMAQLMKTVTLGEVSLANINTRKGFAYPSDGDVVVFLQKKIRTAFVGMVGVMLKIMKVYNNPELLTMLPLREELIYEVRDLIVRHNPGVNSFLKGLALGELTWTLLSRSLFGIWPCRVQTDGAQTGRLHPIKEAAGKVRVVAIVDYFSQVALAPVHDYLFSLLRKIPQDATFDQEGAVETFSKAGHKEIFSYDLKSATDLIPQKLYLDLMTPILGQKAASLWLSLLVDRNFFLHPKMFPGAPGVIRYSRGQPMGALSSWGSMALLHHALVQHAAELAGYDAWFQDYLVLGDDIVIANSRVAKKYLFLCDLYGIKVGLAKSLVSKLGLMNFASQTLINDRNVSPLSLREELTSQSFSTRIELANRLRKRWEGSSGELGFLRLLCTEPQWSWLTKNLRGDGKRMFSIVRFITSNPFGKELSASRLISWLGILFPEIKKSRSAVLEHFINVLKVTMWLTLSDRVRNMRSTLIPVVRQVERWGSLYGGPDGHRIELWDYVGVVAAESLKSVTLRPLDQIWSWISEISDDLPDEFQPGRIKNMSAWLEKDGSFLIRLATLLPTLEELFEAWVLLSKVPPVRIRGDSIYPLWEDIEQILRNAPNKNEGVFKPQREKIIPRWTLVKESMAAPLSVLLLTVARVFGVTLPLFAILDSKPPRILRLALRKALNTFKGSVPTWQITPHCGATQVPQEVVEIPQSDVKYDWVWTATRVLSAIAPKMRLESGEE